MMGDKRILLVDDDPTLAEVLTVLLEDAGFTVKVLSDGRSVIEQVSQFKPCMVMLDYKLPYKDGVTILQEIRSSGDGVKSVPVMMISASSNVQKLAMEAGATLFMAKPFDIEKLMECVKRCAAIKD